MNWELIGYFGLKDLIIRVIQITLAIIIGFFMGKNYRKKSGGNK